MSRFLQCAFASGVALVAALLPTFAQEASDLPKVKILGCEEACAKWTDPKPNGRHSGDFPGAEVAQWGPIAESFVAMRFTITADGHVKDPVLLKLIGPPAFGRASLAAVKDWEYEPATADGVPTERPNWYAEMTYRYPDATPGAGPEVYRAYKRAQELLSKSKFAEVDTLLLPILNKPRLMFYERAVVSLLLSISHGQQKNYTTARDYAEDATLLDGQFLDPDTRVAAMRQRVRLEAATGQYGDALEWFEKLKKLQRLAPDDPEVKLIERINGVLSNPEPIRVAGRIPNSGTLYIWKHTLLRRHFAFPIIEGKLDQVQMECDQKKTVSAITPTAEWHVPKSWSDCHILVTGVPGTLFQFVEANE